MMEHAMLIDGHLRTSASTFHVCNPATNEVIGSAPVGTAADLDAAVSAAARAFPSWCQTGWQDRRAAVLAAADRLEECSDALARLLTMEQGKPLGESQAEVGGLLHFFRQTATLDLGQEMLVETAERRVRARRRPLGVVGAIVPWNFPLMILGFKIPHALLTGNCIVIKPAPTTPLSTLLVGAILQSSFPPGVLNILSDAGDLGPLMSAHPGIAKISFTGSTATGRRIMAAAAPTLKRLTLELGGNDPAVLLDDIDPEAIAPAIYGNAFLNAGQVCVAIKRVYVPDRLHDRLRDALVAIAQQAVLGDGLMQGVTMGPLQNPMQREKVERMLLESRHGGAHVIGGERPDLPGNFLRPAIVTEADENLAIVADEQFGPALPLVRYKDVTEVVRRLNKSPYGLGASVWSTDPDRAESVADNLEAGSVWINGHMDLDPLIPFGGIRQSGIGTEFGVDGLKEFTSLQILSRRF